MNTWSRYSLEREPIQLELLDVDSATAGWVVRRACNTWQAFSKPDDLDPAGVIDLLADGELLGTFSNVEDARQAVVDALRLDGPQLVVAA